jgi:Ser/Thr protein kinase RdoA (MazF antagonist)
MLLQRISCVKNIPDDVFAAYTTLGMPLSVDVIDMGLINKTYRVTTAHTKFILQEMSSIFDTAVIEDGDAVSRYLSHSGICAPTLYRTDSNHLFVRVKGNVFRALKYIEGKSTHTIESLTMAESAGRVLGQFHLALVGFNYSYRSKRRHGGDYRFHRENLIIALKEHSAHVYFSVVEPLAQRMIVDIDHIIEGFSTTARNAHGDPKISNIIFDEKNEALCLVDFDTLGKTGWSLEVGDALRSWCNPNKEDVLDSYVDLKIAEHALKGYGSIMRGHFSEKETQEAMTHCQAITLCLAMRYLTDVLNEKYWAFDQYRFARPAEHNWLRAQAMYGLFMDFSRKKKKLFEMKKDYLL